VLEKNNIFYKKNNKKEETFLLFCFMYNKIMKEIKFTKLEGTKNDFVVINNLKKSTKLSKKEIIKISDRKSGVGFDLLMFLEKSKSFDFSVSFFNADGTEAEMCGNGIRAISRFIEYKNISKKKSFSFGTKTGVIKTNNLKKFVEVDMGKAVLKNKDLNFSGNTFLNQKVKVLDKVFYFNFVSMGNPHCVIFVKKITDELVLKYGRFIESYKDIFPNNVNVEFVEILNKDEINMRVYERGCGETFSCGTGACACVVAGIVRKKLGNKVKVNLLGGSLEIN
jgi:diaminopimelate epimerase